MICSKCGENHPLETMELTFRRPDDVVNLSEQDRDQWLQENDDLCVIEGVRFFVRGILPLPVKSRSSPYNIGLWAEVSQLTFERVYELWRSEDQINEPPFAASIANEVPLSPASLGHEAELRLLGPTNRPLILLKSSTHPLYIEQTRGIDDHRISENTALLS